MTDDFPTPPYPEQDNELLRVIFESAMASYEKGDVDVRGAVMHAAVHGWLEGHLQGEECTGACTENPRWFAFGQRHPEQN